MRAEQKTKSAVSKRKHGFGAITIHAIMRDEILSLVLKPNQFLDEAGLAQRFQVSRSPLREALIKLQVEGLVNTLPNRGSVVAGLDIEGIPNYVDALDLVQRSLMRLAADHRRQDDLDEIGSRLRLHRETKSRGDYRAMLRSGVELRLTVAHASGNPYLIEIYARLLREGQRMLTRCHQLFGQGLPSRSSDCLNDLVEAIRIGDAARAEEMARRDAENLHSLIILLLGQRKTRDLSVCVNPALRSASGSALCLGDS